MSDDLLRKTITQLNFAYGANRRSQEPMKYHIVNLCGKTKQVTQNLKICLIDLKFRFLTAIRATKNGTFSRMKNR